MSGKKEMVLREHVSGNDLMEIIEITVGVDTYSLLIQSRLKQSNFRLVEMKALV